VSDVLDKIRSRGYWDVEIRPLSFDAGRLSYEDLEDVIEGATVRMRGWPVPFIDQREPWLRGDDWVGQNIDALMVSHLETWRLFTSGQFVHFRAITADWGESDVIAPERPGERIIPVWEILFYLTEVVELAARLTLKTKRPRSVLVRVTLSGMADRGLVVGQRNRPEFFHPYVQQQDLLHAEVEVPADDLIAEPRDVALGLAHHLLLRFGWKPAIEQLRGHQLELIDLP
jgi:hypothetical protein